MVDRMAGGVRWWAIGAPIAGLAGLAASPVVSLHEFTTAAAGAALIAAVFAAVHHAEVIAHRVGEPFGTLVLALAVTVIETALIVLPTVSLTRNTAGSTLYGLVILRHEERRM